IPRILRFKKTTPTTKLEKKPNTKGKGKILLFFSVIRKRKRTVFTAGMARSVYSSGPGRAIVLGSRLVQ
ncbi:MAG: hypothetical protein AAGH79_14440, partial [Bacteroidota bacterium]